MTTASHIWLAADYHIPITYSCRIALTSAHSALAAPGPGPATVRLALVRTGIELFGIDFTRNKLFPIIRSAQIRIRPPERVAISNQRFKVHKASSGGNWKEPLLTDSISYREFAHANGLLTIYINVPSVYDQRMSEALRMIGYWGQADSLVYCVAVTESMPVESEVAKPLATLDPNRRVHGFFSCQLAEFRDDQVSWAEIMPLTSSVTNNPEKIELYVWPMMVRERRSGGKLLERCSL